MYLFTQCRQNKCPMKVLYHKLLVQASTQKWMQNESRKRLSSSSSSNFAALLDVERARDKFSEVEEGRKMIVHEQLSVMQR